MDQVCKCVLKKSEFIYKCRSLFKKITDIMVCINSICSYYAQKPCLQGNGEHLYHFVHSVNSYSIVM